MAEVDEYWNCPPVEIGRLPLPAEGEQDVSLIWHQSHEKCGRNHKELGLRVIPGEVEREYVHAKAVFYTPEFIVTIAVATSDAGPLQQIGRSGDIQRRGTTRREFANLQAWFYPQVGALMLWEVDLWRDGEEDPAQDFILGCLWNGFERELLRIFPNTREIITTHEPRYDRDQWAMFLAERRYMLHIENTYRKTI